MTDSDDTNQVITAIFFFLQIIEAMVDQADASFDPILSQWVAERPRQFMPHLVKGMYHIKVGCTKRGNKFVDRTSREQLDAMKVEFDRAQSELAAALDLRKNSALVRAALIQISRATSGRLTTIQLLSDANRLDPLNQSTRWAAIKALDPRWGGRPQDMDLVVDAVARAQLLPARLRALQWQIEMSRATYFHVGNL